MAAYFTCPKCKQKNYGPNVESPPQGNQFIDDLQCKRCGLKGIYWVASEQAADVVIGYVLREHKKKVTRAEIAVGVGDSKIEWMAPDVATGHRDQVILNRLKDMAKLEAPFSQGERTKAFQPGLTAVKEGQCEGQCLHWIRRVLQGGNETYKSSKQDTLTDEQIVFKQRRQHAAGAAAQIMLGIDKKGASDRRDEEFQEIKKKYEDILTRKGFTKTTTPEGESWSIPGDKKELWKECKTKWEDFVNRRNEETKKGFYGYGWTAFAGELDSYLDRKLKVSKRRFSNIIVIKTNDRTQCKSSADFARTVANDIDFRQGTCALISAGLKIGRGEGGGRISGHAIAAHFKDPQELFLFDPNLGIFKSSSKHELQRTLETVISKVWTEDLSWQLDGEFGYSLFRTRDSVPENNTAERGIPYSETPQYTAAENKALGTIPRGGQA